MRKTPFIAVGAALTACLTVCPAAFAADSWPPAGEKSVGAAQPQFSGYRAQDIRDWSPETDPWAHQMRAEVPLQSRIGLQPSVQVDPTMDGKAQIMLMQGDYGNGFVDQTAYNNDYASHAFNFWQYTDYFSPWHGQATGTVPTSLYDPATSDYRSRVFEFGTVNIPNPAYTNAAHRNGVKSIGEIFFAPQNRPGQTPTEFFEKDADGNYIVADKLIEMANYYGFDGWFINDEQMMGRGDADEFHQFAAYLTAHGMWTQWYNNDNSTIDATTKSWVQGSDGKAEFTSNFTNYNWPYYIDKSLANAASLGIDPYTQTFLGIEANQTKFSGSHVSGAQIEKNYAPGTHNPRTSIALFTPSDYYQRGLDDDLKTPSTQSPKMQDPAYQWMVEDRERMYFSGVKSDVTQTGKQAGYARSDVAVNDASGWVGVADFTPSRSVIGGDTFYSSFNTGHGTQYWSNGDLVSPSEWSNINDQSILPSWQWWIDAPSGTKMTADFDYGPTTPRKDVNGHDIAAPYQQIGGYTGGSSLVLYGNLAGKNTMHLFATDLAVGTGSHAAITYANANANGAQLGLGVVLADDTSTVHELDLPKGQTNGAWTTSSVDLSQFAGKHIAAIDLIVDGSASNFQINVGNIQITTDQTAAPAAPTGLTLDQVYGSGEAQLHWDSANFSGVDNYRLYARTADGARHFLGALYGDNLYVKNLPQANAFTFELVAVGKDGQESKPATLDFSYAGLPTKLTVDQSTVATTGLVQAAGAGKLDVSWQAPTVGKEPKNYRVSATILDTPSDAPQNAVYSMLVPGNATSASLPIPVLDGYRYVLTITPTNGSGKAMTTGLSYTGNTHDSLAASMTRDDVTIGGGKYTLHNPTSNDWYTLTVSWNGEKQFTATRGHIKTDGNPSSPQDPNYTLTNTKALPGTDGTLSVELTDYAGNTAAPLTIKVAGGEAVDTPATKPAVTIGTDTVKPGSSVPVSVSGFVPGTEVVLQLASGVQGSKNQVAPNPAEFQVVAADADGNATATLTAPAKKGHYRVSATQSYRLHNTQATADLTVKKG